MNTGPAGCSDAISDDQNIPYINYSTGTSDIVSFLDAIDKSYETSPDTQLTNGTSDIGPSGASVEIPPIITKSESAEPIYFGKNKYPQIIFFRYRKYIEIDNMLEQHASKLNCSLIVTSDKSMLNNLYDVNYHMLVTYGEDTTAYYPDVHSILVDRLRHRWLHFDKIESISKFNSSVNFCYINNVIMNRELSRPIFSIFTTCYNSYNKLNRAYDSIMVQTLRDWEWVIVDDSPDDKHFEHLRKKLSGNTKVRLFRRSENSGNIGNVKNEVISLCRGKYVIEFDHDDEILPNCLLDAYRVFEKNPDVGFVYMDFINIYENGENTRYGDFCGKGYCGYYCQKYNGRWAYVYNTSNINNITLSHLVCLPNHPRIWRRQTLMDIGSYSELLPICDDYEIILRTAMKTKIAKIAKLGYVQYMNDGNNNFSLIRNSEINRLGPHHIMPQFYEMYNVHDRMKELDAFEDPINIHEHVQLWRRPPEYEHKYCNLLLNADYDCQYCIMGVDTLETQYERLKTLYENPRNDFIVVDNKYGFGALWFIIEYFKFDRMKCYILNDATETELEQYFLRIYKSNDNYEIIR